jgi:hypothetical protein
MRKRDLIIENEILKRENEMIHERVEQLQWEHEKLKYRLQSLMDKWQNEDLEGDID